MFKPLMLTLAICLASPAAIAEPRQGRHGGVVVEAGSDHAGHHVEFVVSDTAVTVYLMDEKDALEDTAGASARLVVQDGGKTTALALTPGAGNSLTAALPAPLKPGAKLVVSGKLADGHGVAARFVQP